MIYERCKIIFRDSNEIAIYVGIIGPIKDKAIPETGREGPYGCETLGLPHFLGNQLTDGGVSLTRRPPFTPPERFLVLISVRG
jgi:hypothetical protein